MTPLEKLVKAIQDSVTGAVAAINAAVAPLPPVEQFEAQSELAWPIKIMRQCAADMVERCKFLGEKLQAVTAEELTVIRTAIEAEVRAAIEGSGAFVKKVDHDAAVTSAAETARTETRTAITAELARRAQANAERKTLVDGGMAASAAEALSDDLLLGEAAAKTVGIAAMGARLAGLKKLGLGPENAAEFVAEICGLPLDADGEATATKRLGTIAAAATAAKGLPAAAPVTLSNPLAGARAPGSKTFNVNELV